MAELNKAYASALFSVAEEEGNTAEIAEELKDVVLLFGENPEYTELLSSPTLPKSERFSLIRSAFGGRMPEDLVSFLLLLCEGGHLRSLSGCVAEFDALYRASLHTAVASVRSAVELTEEEKKRIRSLLETKSGKTVSLSCTVDPTLIGGVVAELDGVVYDGSLRRRLYDVKKVME